MDKSTNVYFDFKRSQFVKTLTFKHKNVKDKRIILFMKHLYLKKVVNAFQISIIVASTIITFFESMKLHIFQENRDKKTQIISICLSTYIAVITAIFKFLKIDDRKEEIYKILQVFNDVETFLNHKIKKIQMIQSSCDDEMLCITKNLILCDDDENEEENRVIDICETRKNILEKYYTDFQEMYQAYEDENVENRILDAKKQFHSMFSYNEIIYYKGKIVESMLLDKVHVGNRTILEAPLEEYRNNFSLIKEINEKRNHTDISFEIQEIDRDIERLTKNSRQIYNEDELLFGTSWCNNLCLYFSNICHFCLIMNLYLSLAVKRAKFRVLKRRHKQEIEDQQEIEEQLKFSCCRCKLIDQFIEYWFPKKNQKKEIHEVVYFCCDC